MRSAATLTVAYLLLILQSTVLELAPVRMAAPSLGLLVVLYVGVSGKWALSSASIVALCTGYLLDLVSGAPQGVHALRSAPIRSRSACRANPIRTCST